MGLYTNTGLVRHAQKALALKTKYMWGGILCLVEKQYDRLFKTYGNTPGTGYSATRWNDIKALFGKNCYGCDCVGLIKSYYWSGKADGGTGSPNYGKAGFPDVNAGTMYNNAKKKGTIDTMPEVPGLIVYCKTHPHVGVYIGNGLVIESTLSSRGDGVVKTKLSDFKWEYWFECPYIDYPAKTTSTTNQNGMVVKATLYYPAKVRQKPSTESYMLERLEEGTTVNYIKGSDTKDSKTGYIYVKLATKDDRWIVKSATRR